MNRDELDLINHGLRIASERPMRRSTRLVHRPAKPLKHSLGGAAVSEIAAALQRACERRGLTLPRARS